MPHGQDFQATCADLVNNPGAGDATLLLRFTRVPPEYQIVLIYLTVFVQR